MSQTWQDLVAGSEAGFGVEKRPLFTSFDNTDGEVNYSLIKDRNALVRTDTGAVLSVVSDYYIPIQPARIFSALDPIQRLTGGEWQDARAFKGGRIIAGTLALKNRTFEARPGDPIVPNVVFLGGFSGNLGVRYFLSSLRLYCINVLARLLKSGARQVSIRHAGAVEQAMVRAEGTVEEIVRDIAVLQDQIRLLTNTPATNDLIASVVESILPEPQAPYSATPEIRHEFEIKHAAWGQKVDRVLSLYDSGRGNGQGTAWDLVNGITEYVDHERSTSKRIKDPAEYITMGVGALAKATAFEAALQAAA